MGFIANLLAIPLVTLAMVPLALAGILWQPLWALASALVQALAAALQLLADWPLVCGRPLRHQAGAWRWVCSAVRCWSCRCLGGCAHSVCP